MDFKDLIQKRRSIRKFTDQKLTPTQVETLMRAALMSPSSKNKMPWEFVLIEDKETLTQLSTCKARAATLIADCALAVVVLADPLISNVWIEDASIASLMIQLQAEDLGLGSCWVQIRGRETSEGSSSEEYVKLLLEIPPHMQVLSIIAIGNKAQERDPFDEEKLQWENLHIEKYKTNNLE